MKKQKLYKNLTDILAKQILFIQHKGKEFEQEWLNEVEIEGLREYADTVYRAKFFHFPDLNPHYLKMAAELTHLYPKFQSNVLDPLMIMCKDHPTVKYGHALVFLLDEFAHFNAEDIVYK